MLRCLFSEEVQLLKAGWQLKLGRKLLGFRSCKKRRATHTYLSSHAHFAHNLLPHLVSTWFIAWHSFFTFNGQKVRPAETSWADGTQCNIWSWHCVAWIAVLSLPSATSWYVHSAWQFTAYDACSASCAWDTSWIARGIYGKFMKNSRKKNLQMLV